MDGAVKLIEPHRLKGRRGVKATMFNCTSLTVKMTMKLYSKLIIILSVVLPCVKVHSQTVIDQKKGVGAKTAEWQWSVDVGSVISGETNDHPQAYLWVPVNCKRVRAVVVGQHNMIEEGI